MMSEFGTIVAALEKALKILSLGEAINFEIEDESSGAKSVTLDGWVRISKAPFRPSNKAAAWSGTPKPPAWGIFLASGDGEFDLIEEGAPVEVVKSAIIEVISGRTRDLLDEVLQ